LTGFSFFAILDTAKSEEVVPMQIIDEVWMTLNSVAAAVLPVIMAFCPFVIPKLGRNALG